MNATTGILNLLSVHEKLTSEGVSSTALVDVDPFGGRVVEFCWAGVVVAAIVVLLAAPVAGLPVVVVVAAGAVVVVVAGGVVVPAAAVVVETVTLVLTSDTAILSYVAFPIPSKPCKSDTTLLFKDGICVDSALLTVLTSFAEIVTLAMTEPEDNVTVISVFATFVVFATWVLIPSITEATKA
jgi:hypothetical protein